MPTIYTPGLAYQAGVPTVVTDPNDAVTPSKTVPVPLVATMSVGATGTANPTGTAADPTYTTTQTAALPAGTDRSGTATTTSGNLAAANTARRGLNIQNIGANNIGVNEFGGAAAIGTAGTYTIAPGGSFNVKTNRAITVIAATAATAYTATEF